MAINRLRAEAREMKKNEEKSDGSLKIHPTDDTMTRWICMLKGYVLRSAMAKSSWETRVPLACPQQASRYPLRDGHVRTAHYHSGHLPANASLSCFRNQRYDSFIWELVKTL
jgi:hypothetical protein